MSQVISGHRFGPGFTILYGSYDPNVPPPNADAAGAGIDWMFIRLGSGSGNTWIYRADVGAVYGNGVLLQQAHWTAK